MTHTYPPDIRKFVKQAIDRGEYRSEDELLHTAGRVLREVKQRHQALRRDVRKAIASMDRGNGSPLDMDEIKGELRKRLRARRPKK